MIELKSPKDKLDFEREVFTKIKNKYSETNPVRANLVFNFSFYSALYSMDPSYIKTCLEGLIVSFVVKESNMNYLNVINSAYEISIMTGTNDLFEIACGKKSNLIDIRNDAVKVGALAALYYKVSGIGFFEVLNSLLLNKNVI